MENKYIAFTFDDGPTPGITDQVLDILEQEGVTASFFVIGQQVNEETVALVKRAYDMGCTIENHSFTHPFMSSLTEEEILKEIKDTTQVIVDVVGELPEFFRPPFIDYNQTMYDLIDLGFICGYGVEDWVPEVTTQERVRRVKECVKPGIIILLHDMINNQQTVDAVKQLIPELKAEGYTFVTIRDLFKLTETAVARNVTYMANDEVRED